jgi:hypothetical protein
MKKLRELERRAAEAFVSANRTDDPKESARCRTRAYEAVEEAAARREKLRRTGSHPS